MTLALTMQLLARNSINYYFQYKRKGYKSRYRNYTYVQIHETIQYIGSQNDEAGQHYKNIHLTKEGTILYQQKTKLSTASEEISKTSRNQAIKEIVMKGVFS